MSCSVKVDGVTGKFIRNPDRCVARNTIMPRAGCSPSFLLCLLPVVRFLRPSLTSTRRPTCTCWSAAKDRTKVTRTLTHTSDVLTH